MPKKPEPIEFPSDDLVVTIDGHAYTPHEGESVWIFPGQSVGAVNALNSFLSISARIAAVEGDHDEGARIVAIADEAALKLAAALAPRIARWNWTDVAGRPLPQPDGSPERLMALESAELLWLLTAARGETPARRGEGSRPSPTTSSATEPQPSLTSSGEGHSRRKAS